jgi:RNA polymerase sigma-70 factor (ECF subfamily)
VKGGGELDVVLAASVEAAKSGDDRAFANLYHLLAGKVAGYVRSLGVREVDDVVNEIFLGAFRGLHSFVGDGAGFRTWLFSIAHHKSTDWLRAASRRPPQADESRPVELTAASGDAESAVLEVLEGENVERILSLLTEDQRNVVTLRVIADLSLEQVAIALGKPVGAIKSIQHRAMATLQRTIIDGTVSISTVPANASRRSA